MFVKHTALVEGEALVLYSWVVFTPKQAYCCASCPSSMHVSIRVAPGKNAAVVYTSLR